MKINNFSWKIAGEAGQGIVNAGLLFARACTRGGLYAFATSENPSLIRGGHNTLDIKVSGEPVFSHSGFPNVLVALNQDAMDLHFDTVTQDGGIIYDDDHVKAKQGKKLFNVPLLKIAEECGGAIMRNVVAMGATIALTDYDLEKLKSVLRDNFKQKGEEVVNSNIKAATMGYDYVKKNYKEEFPYKLAIKQEAGYLMSGNQAIAAGAIAAGCRFMAAYPMTPATPIMLNFAAHEKDYNVIMKHAEDELAAINMAIGASFAGARAMAATSGGGFALMTEGLGLASQTETPLVVVEAQRPGPATGMATHTSQGDLRFIMHASTDEFPRIVIAPGDVEDCFFYIQHAFNLAEKYQLPVVFLIDKYLGESYKSVTVLKKVPVEKQIVSEQQKNYKRYKITESGVSPRTIPGVKGGIHVACSYEHDEEGYAFESEENRIAMHEKRFRKFDNATKEINEKFPLILHENADSDITIISWGSTKGPIIDAMKALKKQGININYLHVVFVNPLDSKKITDVMNKAKKTIVIENNMTAQFAGVIKEQTGMEFDHFVLKYDGRPYTVEHICEAIKDIIGNNTKKVVVSTKGIVGRS